METNLEPVARYFWDVDLVTLHWEVHRDFVIQRLLQHGDLSALRWLRVQLGDAGLREWIITRRGRRLNPRQIRYWALILDIDTALADEWVRAASETVWERRS